MGTTAAWTSTRGMLVWIVALSTYLVAVFHRSSLAVAGLIALDRFDISAAQLATFAMLQLLVYAAMQVPVGVLVDRFGPRSVMLTGILVLVAAQTGFAFAESFGVALIARIFVGVGDALTFICVLRLVNTWFRAERVPVMIQFTGVLGQLGAIIAAAPMTWALAELGWTTAYLAAASIGIVLAVLVAVIVADTPTQRHRRGPAQSPREILAGLAESWRLPGTRLGFWMHFCTQFSATTLGLLWGFPFFVQGEGRSEGEAGLLLTIMVVAVMVAGPILGWRTAVRPWHRSTLVLGIVSSIMAVWTVVLTWPGQAPMWLLVVLVVVTGVGGPASVIGFDVGRTSNPDHRLGSATGIINQAGFGASLILVLSIGVILDLQTPSGSDYTPAAFKAAMSAQYVLWVLGLVQVVRYRRRARAFLLASDPESWAAQSRQNLPG